jgi:uncharacterized protein YbcV (DUF1398 family)
MNDQQIAVMRQCTERSLQGAISFPEVVGKLKEIGVERYHADYCRQEKTYYMPDGQSLVVQMPHPPQPIADTFSSQAVEAAIRQIQRGEIAYTEFLRQTMAAGCVGYFVQIAGRKALYFGRNGEIYLEAFPATPKN